MSGKVPPQEIVLGLQGTVDYEVELDKTVLEKLASDWALGIDDLDPERPIDSERDLLAVLLGHLQRGKGGERYVADSEIAKSFAARFTTLVTLGGTCVRAAIAMRLLGIASTVHLVSEDDTVRRLLPDDIHVITSATSDTLDPHLILQWPEGETVRMSGRSIVAPSANRLILANDPPARQLLLSPDLHDAARAARVFLISGLNSIQEDDVLAERLAQLTDILDGMPPESTVLLEDGGYHRPSLRTIVRRALVPCVAISSTNEDELQEIIGRRVELFDPDDVAAAVRQLADTAPNTGHIVHTRHFALAIGPRAATLREALRGGIVMASARYLHGDALTREHYESVSWRTADAEHQHLAKTIELTLGGHATVEPGLTLHVAQPTTIGLGDAFVGGFIATLADNDTQTAAKKENLAWTS